MKRLLLLIIPLIILGCSRENLTFSGEDPDLLIGQSVKSSEKLSYYKGQPLNSKYFVSAEDMVSYIHFKKLDASGKGKDISLKDITPVGPDDETILLYAVNYDEGWELISADKRAPLVLASSPKGSFSLNDHNEASLIWIGYLAEEVLSLRLCNDKQPDFADEKILENMSASVDFWNEAMYAISGNWNPVESLNFVYNRRMIIGFSNNN